MQNGEWVSIVAEYLKLLLSWPTVALILGIALLASFRRQIQEKLLQTRSLSGQFGGSSFSLGFDQSRAVPEPGDKLIEESDVLEILQTLPDLDPKEIHQQLPFLYVRFREQGIITRKQLQAIVGSDNIIQPLKRLYVDKLKRPAERPLDPMAVATYGTALFKYGSSQTVIAEIGGILERSEEAARKNLWVSLSPGMTLPKDDPRKP